ncbi:hypothetical protein PFISCL1PPCAC_1796, partial [Pristionchus fissidentatus]
NFISERGANTMGDEVLFRSSKGVMTFQFIANSDVQRGSRIFCASKKCGFSVTLWSSEIACGGPVSDSSGYLTTPGYPDRLLPRVECEWNLKAGPGKRYLLSLEFTDGHGFYVPAGQNVNNIACFGDVEVIDLPVEYELSHYALRHNFCQNRTEIITPTDQATIRYSDHRTRSLKKFNHLEINDDNLYKPFRIHYTTVPDIFNDRGCQILISDVEGEKNHTMRVAPPEEWQNPLNQFEGTEQLFVCHIMIRRTLKKRGTTSISIKDFEFESPFDQNYCGLYSAVIDMKASTRIGEEMIPFEEKICNSTFEKIPKDYKKVWNKATLVPDIDFYVISPRNMMGRFLEFTIDVEFDKCGGLITNIDGDSGVITSPGFGGDKNYAPNKECQWIIRAPEGHVVQLRNTFMEIEHTYICHKDQLVLMEGEAATVVHRFCHNTQKNDTTLEEKYKKMTSNSRIFVLVWKTDAAIEMKGWQFEYEFLRPNETGCGFITHAMHGIIRSPGAPDNDYDNDLECIWDIQVPTGFVIQVHFRMMDIEKSTDCTNDALTISEEHHGRGWAPNEFYYFIFDKSEMHSPYCDISTPHDLKTESNRIRVNFTTNDKIVGKGFELEYKAVCGGVYQLSHGVLTSPHYPNYFPNEDMECNYYINPELPDGQTKVVTIAINDIQLSDALIQYRRDPCPSDYFQILDGESVIYTHCPFEYQGERKKLSFSVKGAVGIKMVSNKTYSAGEKKLVRGFKITWALNRCGGEFALTDAKKTGFSTTFYSPGYPLNYHDELDCEWTFKTNPDRIFSIRVQKLDIENEENCEMDKLEIHEGATTTNTSLIEKLCGHKPPSHRIYVMNSTMIVKFVTDHSQSHSGFLMEVTATLGPQAGCGGILEATGDWKTFSSPVFDSNINATGLYPSDMRCGWTIKGLHNTIIEMKLTKMKTEKPQEGMQLQTGRTCLDFMAIYDGYKGYSPLIESDLCEHNGLILPKVIQTSNRISHVYFESDHSVEAEGFTMEYRTRAATCGGWVRATREKQTIVYGVAREASEGQTIERCRWVIASNEQAPIWVRITSIKFPMSDCADNYVELRDVGIVEECEHPGCALRMGDRKTMRDCGVKGVGGMPFVSNTLAVQVTNISLITITTGASLNIEYYLLDSCNRTIDARFLPSSHVTSPHFPRPYTHNSSCETTIQVDEKKRILLVFRAFDIEHPVSGELYEGGHLDCQHDYLLVSTFYYETIEFSLVILHIGRQ